MVSYVLEVCDVPQINSGSRRGYAAAVVAAAASGTGGCSQSDRRRVPRRPVAVQNPGPGTGRVASREGRAVSGAFSEVERAYLQEGRKLARIATVGKDGTPHVVPVGMWTYNPDHDSIDVTGRDFAQTKKFRDVARSAKAAIVIDELTSVDPWRPRAIEVRGRAEAIEGPNALIRIHPDRVVSWGLD